MKDDNREKQGFFARHYTMMQCAMWILFGCGMGFLNCGASAFENGRYIAAAVCFALWILCAGGAGIVFHKCVDRRTDYAFRCGFRSADKSAEIQKRGVALRLIQLVAKHNDQETVIGRLKYTLVFATHPFLDYVFGREDEHKGEPYYTPVYLPPHDADRVKAIAKAIWTYNEAKGGYDFTEGFKNETPEFLDAIGVPKDEREMLWKSSEAMTGRCDVCGTVVTDLDTELGDMHYRGEEDDDGIPQELVCHDCFMGRGYEDGWSVEIAREKFRQKVEKERAERAKENGKDGEAK